MGGARKKSGEERRPRASERDDDEKKKNVLAKSPSSSFALQGDTRGAAALRPRGVERTQQVYGLARAACGARACACAEMKSVVERHQHFGASARAPLSSTDSLLLFTFRHS
jgi:hypothetical protein